MGKQLLRLLPGRADLCYWVVMCAPTSNRYTDATQQIQMVSRHCYYLVAQTLFGYWVVMCAPTSNRYTDATQQAQWMGKQLLRLPPGRASLLGCDCAQNPAVLGYVLYLRSRVCLR